MRMNTIRTACCRAGKLVRSEGGSCTVEACFWLPFFLFFFVVIFDATYVFMRNGEVRRIVQDGNRAYVMNLRRGSRLGSRTSHLTSLIRHRCSTLLQGG